MTDWTQGTDLDPTKWTCPFCASQYVRHPENNLSEFLAEYTKVICYPSGEKLLEHIEQEHAILGDEGPDLRIAKSYVPTSLDKFYTPEYFKEK